MAADGWEAALLEQAVELTDVVADDVAEGGQLVGELPIQFREHRERLLGWQAVCAFADAQEIADLVVEPDREFVFLLVGLVEFAGNPVQCIFGPVTGCADLRVVCGADAVVDLAGTRLDVEHGLIGRAGPGHDLFAELELALDVARADLGEPRILE
ncbi:MAG TPA: hypothetical protein VJX66_05195, partial [Amycolatopsis sp.]|nr:hypothetical protein [Amycolatopsis sp.]